MEEKENSKKELWQIAENYKEELIKRITEKISTVYGKNEISQNNGPESLIFVLETTYPAEKQFGPLVSDWQLSEDKEKGNWWVADPHPDPQTGTWDVEIIQTAKKAEIPEPTFKEDQFTSIFTQHTFSRDQLKFMLKDHQEASLCGYKVYWKPVTTRRFDTKRLKEINPEVYEAFLKDTTYRKFTIKEVV